MRYYGKLKQVNYIYFINKYNCVNIYIYIVQGWRKLGERESGQENTETNKDNHRGLLFISFHEFPKRI